MSQEASSRGLNRRIAKRASRGVRGWGKRKTLELEERKDRKAGLLKGECPNVL